MVTAVPYPGLIGGKHTDVGHILKGGGLVHLAIWVTYMGGDPLHQQDTWMFTPGVLCAKM